MIWQPFRRTELKRGVGSAILLVAIFGVCVVVIRTLCTDELDYEAFWPANAVPVVALLKLPPHLSFPVLACCLTLDFLYTYLSGGIDEEIILILLLNIVQILITAMLARQFCGARIDLTRPNRLIFFSIIAFFGSSIEAVIGVSAEYFLLNDHASPWGEWMQWTFCDTLGMQILAPILLYFFNYKIDFRLENTRRRYACIIVVLLCITSVCGFYISDSPLFFFMYPFLAALAISQETIFVNFMLLFYATYASALTCRDIGPIAQISPTGHLMKGIVLQPYLLSLVLISLQINSAIGEKKRDNRRLFLMKAKLRHEASHDPLTSIGNRMKFRDAMKSLCLPGGRFGLFLVDVDDFKPINDTFGHQAGDAVLVQLGLRLKDVATEFGGQPFRIGGDEFALLVPKDLDDDGMKSISMRMARIISGPYHIHDQIHCVTSSIGSSVFRGEDENGADVFSRADMSLYQAKAKGKNGYEVYSELSDGEPHDFTDESFSERCQRICSMGDGMSEQDTCNVPGHPNEVCPFGM